ncbi:hypothetical protein VTK56DRAFT_6877 [Thermocarpiscus australiensis]
MGWMVSSPRGIGLQFAMVCSFGLVHLMGETWHRPLKFHLSPIFWRFSYGIPLSKHEMGGFTLACLLLQNGGPRGLISLRCIGFRRLISLNSSVSSRWASAGRIPAWQSLGEEWKAGLILGGLRRCHLWHMWTFLSHFGCMDGDTLDLQSDLRLS